MTAPERLDDAEREALLGGIYEDDRAETVTGYFHTFAAVERIVAQRVARAVAEAKAEGWDEGYYHSLHSEPMENPYRADREAQP